MSERVPAMVSHRGVAGYKGPGVTTFDPTAQPADQVAGPAWQSTDYVPPSGSSPTPASQAEMEAGTETAIRSMSPLRVAQAVGALAPEGGGLPSWWTVDDTPGTEKVTFAGQAAFLPTQINGLNDQGLVYVKAPVGSGDNSVLLFQVLSETGPDFLTIRANGQIDMVVPSFWSDQGYGVNIGAAGGMVFDVTKTEFALAGGISPKIFAATPTTLGFFDKAGSKAAQQVLARPSGDSGDLWDIFEAFGFVVAA